MAFISAACLAFGTGCVIDGSESGANATVEQQTEVYIDHDNHKEGALGLIFGMSQIDDRLDFNGGDREDWRYIVVTEEQCELSITMNIDQPGNIDGGWKIIDADGRTRHEQVFSKSQGYYEFKNFHAKRGVYYFQTFVTAGKSIYSLASECTPSEAVVHEPPPVIEEEEEAYEEEAPVVATKKSSSSSGKRRSSSGSKKSEAKPDSAPVEEAKPAKAQPKAAEEPSGSRVVGDITMMTPQADGSYEIKINAGKNKGVETGTVGTIEGTSIKIETTICFATSCKAVIPESANPKSLKKGAKVTFRIK